MIHNKLRNGNFTSSEICALMKLARDGKSFGAPAFTYIEETNMERKLQRSISDETSARPLIWGKLIEARAFELLGLEYSLCSTDTLPHPTINFWSGSPDGKKVDTVLDIKCPITLKSFCQLVDPLYCGLEGIEAMNAIRNGFIDNRGLTHSAHKDAEKYYWQLVSNAIITGSKYAELIVYIPYQSELEDIRLMAQNVEGSQASKHYWIAMAEQDELPYIHDNGYYKNINIIRFEVPESDKEALTKNVEKAGEMLFNPDTLIAEKANIKVKKDPAEAPVVETGNVLAI